MLNWIIFTKGETIVAGGGASYFFFYFFIFKNINLKSAVTKFRATAPTSWRGFTPDQQSLKNGCITTPHS